MTIRFVIDDLPWADAGLDQKTLIAGLEELADLLRGIVVERQEPTLASDNLYGVRRIGGRTLTDLLFDWSNELPRDLRVELMKIFDRVNTNAIESTEFVELEVVVAGAPWFAAAVAYAATETHGGKPVAVVTPAFSSRTGRVSLRCGESDRALHFVSGEESRLEFVRGVIVKLIDEDEFVALTPSAFPRLYFVENVFNGLRLLSKPLRDLIEDLVHHLSVLSDHGTEIFELRKHQLIEAEFQALGIHISPENTETLNDGACKRARTRSVAGVDHLFDWHTKLQPHVDRIHVHPGTAQTEGRVAVGVIHRHLPLPGD